MGRKAALLIGATGLIGGHCLELLLKSDQYNRVVALVRRPLAIKDKKLEEHIIDFDKMEEKSSLFKAEDLYCCLGTTMKKAGSKDAFFKVDFDYSTRAAKLAATNGARSIMLLLYRGRPEIEQLLSESERSGR